ncbi:DUF637 domain-containing protein [Vibrio sp. La 4.2.2]|uniref:two-partner secretion domain-containing protein n=1 Tax=Vibrio sp. La 4.2.2 TaxID=2998830 RepID=UPI0022CDD3E7|nr:DUF637 domain-containing protein [Vibrio sp. La 4.2.2]MDA0107926.1 DUF637 domain-containing protein [Vibrio sp. La 4.2.2]
MEERLTPLTTWQRTLTYGLCVLINVQPALASVVVSSGNTKVINAGNGVEVVNIATPNEKGLSHNRYQQFDVDSTGLILNNSTEQLEVSELGGYLSNNPNLTNGAASVILNEVTGASRSELQGYTEVFGDSAPVILTNPYGITCNGCGFINTPRVTLSTGSPEISHGVLTGFDVSQGNVLIGEAGLDATNQDYFDIISRAARVNGELHGEALNVVTGPNRVRYGDNNVLETKTGQADAPRVAIDSSALGGMYAGRIALVATESGVGVNVGNLSGQSVSLTADGRIELGSASATQALTVTSREGIRTQGQQVAGQSLTLEAETVDAHHSQWVSGEEVSVQARHVSLTESSVEAPTLSGEITSLHLGQGSTLTADTATLTSLNTLSNQGDISISSDAALSGDTVMLTGSGTLTTPTLSVSGRHVTLDGAVQADDVVVTAQETLTITDTTPVQVSQSARLTAEDITQSGHVQASTLNMTGHQSVTQTGRSDANVMAITGNTVDLGGAVNVTSHVAGQDSVMANTPALTLQGTTVQLTGQILSQNDISIVSDTLLQQGRLASNGDITLTQSESAILDGQVQGASSITAETKTLTSSGELNANESITLTADTMALAGSLSTKDMSLTTKTLTQQGALTASRDVSLAANHSTLDGQTYAGRDLMVSSAALDTTASSALLAQNHVQIDSDDWHHKGRVLSANDVSIDAASWTNEGSVQAANHLKGQSASLEHHGLLEAGSDLTFEVNTPTVLQGDMVAGRHLSLTGDSVTNQGELSAGHTLTLTANVLTNQALLSGQHVTLETTTLSNTATATLQALKTLSLTTEDLTNHGEVLSFSQAWLRADDVLDNQGLIAVMAESGDGQLSLTSDTLTHSGSLASQGTLTLDAQEQTLDGSVVSTDNMTLDGQEIAISDHIQSAGTLSVTSSDALSMTQDGAITSQQNLTLLADSIHLDGRVMAKDAVTVTATSLNQSGQMASHGDITLISDSLSQQGSLQGQNVTLRQRAHTRIDGDIQADKMLDIQAGTLSSTQKLVSGQAMTLRADGHLALSGVAVSNGTLDVQSDSLTQTGDMLVLDALSLDTREANLQGQVQSVGSLTIDTKEALTITNTANLTSHQELTVNAGTLHHQGDWLSGGNSAIQAQTVTNQGTLNSLQGMTLNTDTLNHQGILAANDDIALTITSDWVNTHDITAGGDLSVSASRIDNRASLSAKENLSLSATTTLTNRSDIVGNHTTLTAKTLTNQGTIQALSSLGLNADTLHNQGALASFGDLTAQLSGALTNMALMYAANNAMLYSHSLDNQGDLLAGRHMILAKNAALEKNSAITNRSGHIEATHGNMTIATQTLTNERTTLDVTHTTHQDQRGQFSTEFDARGTQYQPEYDTWVEHRQNSKGHGNHRITHYELLTPDHFSVEVFNETLRLNSASQASSLLAGNNVHIEADNVNNHASHIAASNVHIQANSLTNTGYEFGTTTTTLDYELPRAGFGFNSSGGRGYIFYLQDSRTTFTNEGRLTSSITATHNLTMNVANTVNNDTLQVSHAAIGSQPQSVTALSNDSAALTGPSNVSMAQLEDVTLTTDVTIADKTRETSRTASVTGPERPSIGTVTLETPTYNEVDFPDYRLPTSPNGLFIYSDGPSSEYVIETNPLLTQKDQFLGSGYFLDSLNYHPENDITFLGDAYYDTKVITQAIMAQTGQRYLSQDIGTDLAQMRALMDAAANEQQALSLEAGIALSAEQIAGLSQDILWYERVIINGEEVLAPKLYLANLDTRDLHQGGVISGENVLITAGAIQNSGQIAADDALTLVSEQSIVNRHGELLAGGDLTVLATGDIVNHSGQLAGDNVTLISQEGDIVNETLKNQFSIDANGRFVDSDASNITLTQTVLDDFAEITATGNLTLQAGGNLSNIGATLESAGDMTLAAMDDITLGSVDSVQYQTMNKVGTVFETLDSHATQSVLESGGNVTLSAGNDITAIGAALSAKKTASLNALGDIALLTDETVQLDRQESSKRKDITQTTTHQGTTLWAQDIGLQSGGDTTLIASELSANDALSVGAGGALSTLAAIDSHYSRQYRESSGFWGTDSNDVERTHQTVNGTDLSAGGSLTLNSQGNQTHQASIFHAGDDIALNSEDGTLNFTSATEYENVRQESVSSGLMVTMEGKGHTKTIQVVTQMQSDGDITLASALGMNVDYVRTDNDLAKALNDIPANSQTAWMTALKDNPKVNWNEVNEAFDSWEYSESNLSAPAAAIIAIVVTVVSAGAASSAGAALVSATGTATTAAGTTVAAVGTAASSTLMTQGALALANNQGDIGAALKELGSSDKLRHLATAMVTAGALAGFDVVTGFSDGTFPTDNMPSVSNTQLASGNSNIYTPSPVFTPESLLRQAGRSTVQAGVDSAINGSDFADGLTQSLRGALANNLGAVAADTIGDLGAGNVIEGVSFENGSLTKTALHAVTQGAAAELAGGEFAAGAAAGAASELIGDALGSSGLGETTQVGMAGLAGAVAGVAVTGDAEGAYTGQTAGSSVHQNNHLNHTEKTELEMAKSRCANGDNASCEKRNELNRLDYERDQSLQVACSVGSASECESQLALAQANYDSYDGNIKHDESIAIGQERESIAVVLGDPDGSKRLKDQQFLDDLPANTAMVVGAGCSVLLLGGCATVAGAGEISMEVLDYFSGLEDGKISTDSPLGGKPIIGVLNENISNEISKLPLPPRAEMLLQGANAGFGIVIDKVVDNEKE